MEKSLKKAVMVVIALSLLMGCATTKGSLGSNNMFLDDTVTVVIIPGAGEYNAITMGKWQKAFPGSVIIVPRERWPLSSGAEDIARQIEERRITGRVAVIGLSFGGNSGREFNALFPNLVVAVATVGSPNTVRFMPEWPSSWSIRPDDANCRTPLFVVAGVKLGTTKPVWMDEPSDGTVGLKQATDLRNRKAEEIAIFKSEHSALFESDEVIAWVWERINPFLKPKQTTTLVASKATEK